MLGHRALGDSGSRESYQVTMAATALCRATATASFAQVMLLGATGRARATASAVLGNTAPQNVRLPAVFNFSVPADR